MVQEGLYGEGKFDQRFEWSENSFQAEEIASAKALRDKNAWHVYGTEWKAVWLECYEQGLVGKMEWYETG